ncbi:MAG: FAD-dependent oxidoreductase [bacterium]|nr:FAD-dependent oxidoreductase [bacterium]
MTIFDLIIIGGGPAGISAGIYSARQKMNTLLITKSFGGQIARKAVGIENYLGFEKISGLDLINKFEKHLRKHDILVEKDGVRKIEKKGDNFFVHTTSKKTFISKSVIVASGADPRPLEITGEKEFIGRGVSYCVTCDAPLFADKKVAVIGGGNSGFEAALFLSKWVEKIYIFEHGQKVKADESIQEKARKTGKIEVIVSTSLKKIKGKKFVESIVYQAGKVSKANSLAIDGIFVEIGSQPANSFLSKLVNFNQKDEIMFNPRTMQTKTAGLFVAGDVSEVVFKQIVIAAGEGAKAALSASNYLRNKKE